jgi:uncharacterized protein YegL
MPQFDSIDITNHKAGHFDYTAISQDALAELGSSEQTLVTIVVDKSGSTGGFESLMEDALKKMIEGCAKCPRADFLLVRVVTFNHDLYEVHGYQPLSACIDDQGKALPAYDGILRASGTTALYDATIDCFEATADFGKKLQDEDYDVNGIVVVLTDGWESGASTFGVAEVKGAFQKTVIAENLESMVSILVGLDHGDDTDLQDFKNQGGFTEYIKISDVDQTSLGKLVDWVSESVSSQSQALGTGGPSAVPQF